jgi:insulin-like growth factor 2 receptor
MLCVDDSLSHCCVVLLQCQYQFVWPSSVACGGSTGPVTGSDCRVFDPARSVYYDLSGLASVVGRVNASGYAYSLRVCGALNTTKCPPGSGACQEYQDSSRPFFAKSLGAWSAAPVLENGILYLKYSMGASCHGNQYNRSVVITFVCGTGTGSPVFVAETGDCSYLFRWETSAACALSTADVTCVVPDPSGGFYDLSALMRSRANWVAASGDSSDGFTYAINVCRPLVASNATSRCPSDAGACQLKNSDASFSKSLGRVSSPVLVSPGVLQVTYTSGSLCHGVYPRQTIITFTCQYGSLGVPVFLHETDDCQYVFSWATSAACLLQAPSTGSDCQVQDSSSGEVYDLSPLRAMGSVNVTAGGYVYELAVCGAIRDSLSRCKLTNAGACQFGSLPDQVYPLGVYSDAIVEEDGRLSVLYTGGQACHDRQYVRSVLISFVCVPGGGVGKPQFSSETADCTYLFVWPTQYACPTVSASVDCIVVDPENRTQFDLRPLTKTMGNWQVFVSGDVFDVNVCRGVNVDPSAPGQFCRSDVGVCKKGGSSGSTALSYGSVGRPRFINGQLTIVNENGDTCAADASRKLQSVIMFSCGIGIGAPQFSLQSDPCTYVFSWTTQLACVRAPQPTVPGNCSVSDSLSGYVFNMTALASASGQPFVIPGDNGVTYSLDVCRPLRSACDNDPGAGVCVTASNGQQQVGGLASSSLKWRNGLLSLVYEGGSRCAGPSAGFSSSVLQFVCDSSAGRGAPRLTYSDGSCFQLFSWPTSLACLPSFPCQVNGNGRQYDLSSLASASSWKVQGSGRESVDFNICGLRRSGVSCGQDSGVCGRLAANGEWQSYGSVRNVSTNVVQDGRVVISMGGGGDCGNGQQRRTVLEVVCALGTVGTPVLKSMDACLLEMTWMSGAGCAIDPSPVTGSDCRVRDPQSGLIVDLNGLRRSSGDYLIQGSDNSVFVLNMCGPVIGGLSCPVDASACLWKNGVATVIGKPRSSPVLQAGTVTLSLAPGDVSCNGGTGSAVVKVLFSCDASGGIGEPQFSFVSQACEYVFTWQTTAACGKNDRPVLTSTVMAPTGQPTAVLWTSGVVPPAPSGAPHDGGNSGGGVNVGLVVGVVVPLLLVIVGLVVLFAYSSRAREAATRALRGCWSRVSCKRRAPHMMSFTSLRDDDHELFGLSDGTEGGADDGDDDPLPL